MGEYPQFKGFLAFVILVYMTTKRFSRIVPALFVILILGLSTKETEARYSAYEGYSSAIQKKINALDDDKVEGFYIPVLFGVSLKNVTPNFGDPRDGGARTHEGLDIVGKKGTPIVSPTEAVVISTGSGESSGKYVRTANPGGELFVYMHLDELADLDAGDVLQIGDFIGTVGDTGNAQGGGPHLHFEVRTSKAYDPFPRIQKEFSFKEKINATIEIFKNVSGKKEQKIAAFLAKEYKAEMTQALNGGYALPRALVDALKKEGVVSTASLQDTLNAVIDSIPKAIDKELSLGAQGSEVSLLQFFLIHKNSGPQALALKNAKATGYFGEVTKAAFVEYQQKAHIAETGAYDFKTREMMMR
jgi:peptidoglycan hydrolase-like protein with peptidoglycan-binding domain